MRGDLWNGRREAKPFSDRIRQEGRGARHFSPKSRNTLAVSAE